MTYQPSDQIYSGAFLPHTEAMGRPQMITFHLGDSIPREIYHQLTDEVSTPAERRRICERYLDRGRGRCWLNNKKIAGVVSQTLKFYDDSRYHLVDWVVMPNHVHVVYDRPAHPMGSIVKDWKSYSGQQCNRRLGRRGQFWRRDYFDRYARCPRHLFNMSCYVLLNPVKAGLVDDPFQWPFSSIHDYHPDFKEDLRRWYRDWKERFWIACDE